MTVELQNNCANKALHLTANPAAAFGLAPCRQLTHVVYEVSAS